MTPDEYDSYGRQRRRWDRLVALHLLVLAFIHRCGHSWHRGESLNARIGEAAQMLLDPEHLHSEFAAWLPRLGLAANSEIRVLLHELEAAAKDVPRDETDEARAARVAGCLEAFPKQATASPSASGRFRRDPAVAPVRGPGG